VIGLVEVWLAARLRGVRREESSAWWARVVGRVPGNIVTRSADDDWDGGDEFDDSDFDDLDGDDVPQDADFDIDPDESRIDDSRDDDSGPVAENIARDARGVHGALGVIPGPLSRSRM
jgi:hypothetical protein